MRKIVHSTNDFLTFCAKSDYIKLETICGSFRLKMNQLLSSFQEGNEWFCATGIIDEVMSSSLHFPTDEDFSGAAFSLAQLQAAYRLNVSQLARGNFQMSDNVYSSARGLDGMS